MPVLATGEVLGRTWVLMEYFPGRPLRERLTGAPLATGDLRAIFSALAAALEHAHARGVVHQDVKPENVLVRAESGGLDVKLADFGLAAELGESERRALVASRSVRSADAQELRSLAGTLPYLAPERLEGAAPHPRADVFSTGVLLFEALTGRAPGGLELPSELRPGLDARWDAVLKRSLARDPARRTPSVVALRAEVEPLLHDTRSARTKGIRAEAPPEDLILIPQGSFAMGNARDADARPVRTVSLPAFFIDRAPVTNGAYAAFVLATGARAPASWASRGAQARRLPASLAAQPVTGITWDEAAAFAAWAKKRLPTEAEWERAEPSLEGKGQVWEWCADWFGPYDPGDTLAPTGPARGEARVIRGGRDPSRPGSGAGWFRGLLRPDVTNPKVGFRCARTA